MSFDNDLRSMLRVGRADGHKLGELARAALDHMRENDVLPLLDEATRNSLDARLWQWKGLLERGLDEHAEAFKSLAKAAALAPGDASIAHGHARVALEAGIPAVQLFERALPLEPGNAQIYLGLNAARIAVGRAGEAEADLERVLERSPLWLDGHHQLSQLRALQGRREQAFDSLHRAIARDPRQPILWQALFELVVLSEDYSLLRQCLEQARSSFPDQRFHPYEFIAAAENGQTSAADALCRGENVRLIPPTWLLRHYLRSGRIREASVLLDTELAGTMAADVWPYAPIVWQISGDPRLDWLTGHASLLSVIDLSDQLATIPGILELLRSLHQVSGRYLNQSVRGGSQTDGSLFSRVEPEIRSLRAFVVRAVEKHCERLADLPDLHPQKAMRRNSNVRFSGSWSIRLIDGGFHTAHVHPRGWISSALYIHLPQELAKGEGCLVLGEPPPELGLDLPPATMIEPRVGQLVLFPSWMWHGTRPFPKGERLSVAFDVAH